MIAGLLLKMVGGKGLALGAAALLLGLIAAYFVWDYSRTKAALAQAHGTIARVQDVNNSFAAQVNRLEEDYKAAHKVREALDAELAGLRSKSEGRTIYINSKRGKFNEALKEKPAVAVRAAGIALYRRMRAIESAFDAHDAGTGGSGLDPSAAAPSAAAGESGF